ncbi:hypothetical protein SNOG_03046 [Parastagonospora nodorum SN15]|uniref:CBF1-interacting co-repressor CIR N-terminal domain-containing protein n=1 Tax=Phaeosphaeria nodorum (strain SN15 / ATCC MYA-4574 / FGSC 10173) TaxID=321614 RepID=Q0UYW8_PHANO|nr:hypothetical protein SNOG_03046 [Parastagonospora nodorum SN15]EAT89777.2 hypothetical protein SNOG_03046 [Parastagonospora nodorum SN15]
MSRYHVLRRRIQLAGADEKTVICWATSANIARVKADEEAAAAREAADEQRMQELDAARRAAILRGQTPPPLPDEAEKKDHPERKRERDDRGHTRKRRKLAGEDDTDMDIRLAASITAPKEDDDEKNAKVLKLRNTKLDAPLTDHAGHIDLFPIDTKEANKREKNAEVEKEKRRKERAFEDQYTMRFSNAAGREGLDKPWYAAQQKHDAEDSTALDYPHLENKNVWGNEDPRRKEREHARITSNDPFAFMQQAQSQLKKAKQDKKKWAAERERELRELRAAQEREDRRERHHKRKRRDEDHVEVLRRQSIGGIAVEVAVEMGLVTDHPSGDGVAVEIASATDIRLPGKLGTKMTREHTEVSHVSFETIDPYPLMQKRVFTPGRP